MQTYQGIAVSPGVAIGEAFIVDNEGIRISRRFIAKGTRDAAELARLEEAFARASQELERHRQEIGQELGDQYAAIFSAHLQIMNDPQLRREIEHLVRDRDYSPEFAVSRSLRRYARIFEGVGSSHIAERANDVFDIKKRLLNQLLGNGADVLSGLTSPVILLAHHLTPSEAAALNRDVVKGLVCETGGAGGHTAIVAQALGIPAVMGAGEFLGTATAGDEVVVDGDHGRFYLHPDRDTVSRFVAEQEQHQTLASELAALCPLPAETTDKQRIRLMANIEFPQEVDACLQHGADGIGLYRTEFLYLGSKQVPTEQDHYEAYCRVLRAMADRCVVIRTLDLGADKISPAQNLLEEERNPFLGLRSIRLSLRYRSLFQTQLRALLRASELGDLRVMFPLITTLDELRTAKTLLAQAREQLAEDGLEVGARVQVGMMVEVPAAVVMLDRFLPEVDFISIGTNDLVQYALAVDRGNKEVAELYTPSNPAVLRLIKMTVDVATEHGTDVAMCGQMSGSPLYVPLLLGLGLRELSVPPIAIPEVKSVCRSVSIADCQRIAEHAMSMDRASDITQFLTNELRQIAPQLSFD